MRRDTKQQPNVEMCETLNKHLRLRGDTWVTPSRNLKPDKFPATCMAAAYSAIFIHENFEQAENMDISRDTVLKIIEKKDKIENEIGVLMEVLASHRVGMHDPLVDHEGFPRQDIDIYQIRHARHKIVCLQNDHKAVMKEIENGLYALHSNGASSQEDVIMDEISRPSGDPIAVVNEVTPGSAASIAGLEVHDKIIEFGSVNASNFQSLLNISFVAESSINRSVPVVVLRDKRVVRLSITPKPWMGPGLLGCNILLPENVDR